MVSNRSVWGALVGTAIFLYLAVSTMSCFGFIVHGLLVCSFYPDAAVCGDRIVDIFHFFYWDMWIGLLDPANWGFGR